MQWQFTRGAAFNTIRRHCCSGSKTVPFARSLLADGHILFYRAEDPIDIEDYVAEFGYLQTLYDNASYSIHLIADLRNMRMIPANFMKVRYSPSARHPRMGITVLIGTSWILRKLITSTETLTGRPHTWFVSTEEEAMNIVMNVISNEQIRVE